MNEVTLESSMATQTTKSEQASEESRNLNTFPEEHPSGAKAPATIDSITARLKSCPVTKQQGEKIPATMKAVIYRGVNDLRLETVPVPEIGPGELLVKIATCGVCGTDLKKIHSGSHSAPRIFGHEMAGTIVQLGEGVENFAVGERVV